MLGDIEVKKVNLDDDVASSLNKRFIALDTETTGLDPTKNVITEIGLVLFENGKITKKYGSLINIKEDIPAEITNLTGITREMLDKAPSEEEVYKNIVDFLGDALDEKTIIVAHNASFDMAFIERTLVRFGYIGVIRYADTLSISRSLIKGLFNYKQDTVATYFNLVNEASHRALSDATICGLILVNLLNVYKNGDQTLNITTPYDSFFEEKVRERGIIYYRFNSIKYLNVEGSKITSIITGANTYNIELEISDNKIEGKCNCPYYQDNNKLCKHIYATVIKYMEDKK